MSEKTHQPTAKKLRDAQKKGQIPRSKLFTSAAVTLGGLGATLAFADDTTRRFVGFTRSLLSNQDTPPVDAMKQGVEVLALCAAPSLAGAVVAAMLSAVAMSGLQFNAEVVSPKLERLDFTEGVKKLFSARQLVDVFKGLAVAAIIFWLFWSAVKSNASLALSSVHHDGGQAFAALVTLAAAGGAQGGGAAAGARRRRLGARQAPPRQGPHDVAPGGQAGAQELRRRSAPEGEAEVAAQAARQQAATRAASRRPPRWW